MPLRLSDKCLGVVKAVLGRGGTVFWVPEGVSEFPKVFRAVRVCMGDFGGCVVVFSFNFLQFKAVTNGILDIFQ